MPATNVRIVLVNGASRAEARTIARALIEPGLAAAVNLVPGVDSLFRWKGRIVEGGDADYLAWIARAMEAGGEGA